MANVQALFELFHRVIRTDYDTNETLREKKDIIVERVNAHLKQNNRPTCQEYLQGSYKMKVGICALAGQEFDIDVGLRFSFDDSRYSAEEVRRWVFEAVDGHTQKVEAKVPCIRVTYADGYHVDLVCYAWWDDDLGIEQHRLAHKSKGWRPADPPKLVQFVRDARRPFDETKDNATGTDQFRRVVRYLKRWNDHSVRRESDDKPTGLALLLLTNLHLSGPKKTWDGSLDDHEAVACVARAAAATPGRIVAFKPTPEGEDIFARISDAEMTKLKERFGKLRDALAFAKAAPDATEACKELKKVFGDDFPCPGTDKDERSTARRTAAPAIVPSSSSAS